MMRKKYRLFNSRPGRRSQQRATLNFQRFENRLMLSGTPNTADPNDEICETDLTLFDGQTLEATVNPITDVDLFAIEIPSSRVGREITFNLNETDVPFDTYLRLFDDAGTELDANDDASVFGTTNSQIDFTFSSAGTYYLGVSTSGNENYDPNDGSGLDTDGFSSTGSYEITFQDTNDQIDEASDGLLDGVVSSATIDTQTDVDVFRFDAVGGQRFRFFVDGGFDGSTPFELDPFLRIFDDSGVQLASNDNQALSTDSELAFTFPTTSDYYIGVSTAGNSNYDVVDGTGDTVSGLSTTGDYSITATEESADTDDTIFNANDLGNLFTDGTVTASGEISVDADVDMYQFEVGRTGSFVEIDLDTALLGVNSRLRLFNANGVELNNNIDSSSPGETGLPRESFIGRFLSPGIYFVGVSAQDNATYSATTGLGDTDGDSTGSYTIDIQDRLHVDTTDDTNTGTFADNDDKNTLREAIAFANDTAGTQTITFQSNVFVDSSDTIVLSVAGTNQLEITDSVILSGLGADRVTVSGNDNSRVFLIDDGNDSSEIDVSISGMTIRDGNTSASPLGAQASEPGAGILNRENLTLQSVIVTSNRSDEVGADNGDNGGGLFHELGVLVVEGSTFSDNSALNGGGIRIVSGNADIINSTVSGNRANSNGGGISSSGNTTIRNSTVTGNRGDFDDNTSENRRGGVIGFSGSLEIHNTIIAGNFDGPGSAPSDLAISTGVTSVASHNIIAAPNSNDRVTDGENGNIVGNGSGGDLPVESILTEVFTSDGSTLGFDLVSTSPAINAGSNAEAIDADGNPLTSDQFGDARIQFGTVDIGSRESSFDTPSETPSLVVTIAADVVDSKDFETSLREAINFANSTPGTGTITFDAGLSGQTITLGGSQLVITDSVTIEGPGVDQFTISGDDSSRVFLIDDGDDNTEIDVTLRDLTVRDGNTTLGSGNPTGRGAGILNTENLTLEDVAVRSNRSDLVSGSIGSRGGGLAHSLGELLVTGSTFADNSSLDGGGIDIASGSVDIINSTLYGNTVRGNGAGIRVEGAATTVTVRNSTITGNIGDDNDNGSNQAGGIHRFGGTVTLHNTLVAGNFGGTDGEINDLAGTFASASSHNLIGEQDSGVSLNNGTNGNIVGDGNGSDLPIAEILTEQATSVPGLEDKLEFLLIDNGPAVNAGSNAEATDADGNELTNDQFGNNRIQSGTVDIGARESAFGDLFLLGDADLNGVVNFLDIQPFIDLLSSNTFLNEADIDRDGDVDFLDIQPFIDILSSGGSVQNSFTFSSFVAPVFSSEPVATAEPVVAEPPAVSAASVVAVAQPVEPVSQLSTVVSTFNAQTAWDTDAAPVAIAPSDYDSLKNRHSSLKSTPKNRSLFLKQSLAGNTNRPELLRESSDQHRSANESVERSFSIAADLFDAKPESLDEVFDSQLEETLIEFIQ